MTCTNGQNSAMDQNMICVFCASRDSSDPAFNVAANELGREIAKSGYGLVYGGGNQGLMGRVARTVHENGGQVLGITPRALTKREGGATYGRTVLVDSMHERKGMMNDNAMSFIALPGGFGTMEELLEITTWSLLSIHSKPVVVLNINGYYDALKDLIDKSVAAGFVLDSNRNIMVFCDTPQEAVAAISKYQPPETRYKLTWSIPPQV
ncbi:hypothetical protein H4R99_000222 [Coemansia sp. RSA 1722]|nr:hypothetical protein LPJ57_005754 [Coemansia sp. RSA 486]KAJ2238299.1 hypothetical protein IWW45_000129 [Coemansia sp. RSA 485]KAJ2606588.1 hypothetical protein H4R99_000222 [Coemansia sp. RSA 1722]